MGLFGLFKKKSTIAAKNESAEMSTHNSTIIEAPEKVNASQTLNVKKSVETAGPPPLSTLVKIATPSKQGLYPHEIMMLEYAPHFKTANNTFQNFWYWQYSVTDPQTVLDSLFERGFIENGDLRSALERLKLPEIKEELKHLDQKLTGKKAELIDRLLENGDINCLNQKYSERYFVRTQKGEQELKDNQYVSYLHRHRVMSVWEMNQRLANTHYPYRDILWGYFNEQSGFHFQNFDFGLYRNTRLDMYQFLMEEDKPKTAFHLLCEVLSFDLSGLSNNEKALFEWEKTAPESFLMIYESRVEHFFPYEETTLIIPPAVSGWFAEMQETLGLNDKDFRLAILKELQDIHPPRRVFTDEECADIIIADICDDKEILSSIYKKAEKREKAKLKDIRLRIK